MKELKFRAWDGKKMIDDVVPSSETSIIELFEYEHQVTEVEAVEQYTGLKDKNGKEIYEGDIMIFDACLYKVVWNEEYAGFDYETIGEWGVTSTNVFNEGAVIGNIHENPDLLEE